MMRDSDAIEEFWSAAAASFDDGPDHGLRDPSVRRAWGDLFSRWLPAKRCSVVDLGCGTGSLSVLLAELGHDVTGVDFSPSMIAIAEAKGRDSSARFLVGDVQRPDVPRADVVVARHVLWTLPDPRAALARWADLLEAGGRMILIEGRWFDPGVTQSDYPADVASRLPWNGGVGSATLIGEVSKLFDDVQHTNLSDSPRLWGRPVADERYALVASRTNH